MTFTNCKYYLGPSGEVAGVKWVAENGELCSALLTDKEFQQWLAEGNTPLPADAPVLLA